MLEFCSRFVEGVPQQLASKWQERREHPPLSARREERGLFWRASLRAFLSGTCQDCYGIEFQKHQDQTFSFPVVLRDHTTWLSLHTIHSQELQGLLESVYLL